MATYYILSLNDNPDTAVACRQCSAALSNRIAAGWRTFASVQADSREAAMLAFLEV